MSAPNSIVLEICQRHGAQRVTKGKSMISEEIGINAHLEEAGLIPVETDLGEYIIQLRQEPPSHIIAPAVHLSKEQVAETFKEHQRTSQHIDSNAENKSFVTDGKKTNNSAAFVDNSMGLLKTMSFFSDKKQP